MNSGYFDTRVQYGLRADAQRYYLSGLRKNELTSGPSRWNRSAAPPESAIVDIDNDHSEAFPTLVSEGRAGARAAISASRFRISTPSLIRPVAIAARARSSRAGMRACSDAFACSAAPRRSLATRCFTLAFVSSLAADARVAPFGGREYASA